MGAELSDGALFAFLRSHPDVRDRLASIALTVENSEGDLKEADAAEDRFVEETRRLGREALLGWAERQAEVTERETCQQPQMHRQGEEESAGIRISAR